MSTDTNRKIPWSSRVLGLGAAVAAIAALSLVLVFRGGGAAPLAVVVSSAAPSAIPSAVPGGSVGTGSASCVEPYTRTALTHRTFAFDGTVSAVSGDRVTFTVSKAFRGAGGTVTLDAPGMTGTAITSVGGPNLSVGQRYLVAGDDHFVLACGYTQPYDAGVATEWSAALGG